MNEERIGPIPTEANCPFCGETLYFVMNPREYLGPRWKCHNKKCKAEFVQEKGPGLKVISLPMGTVLRFDDPKGSGGK